MDKMLCINSKNDEREIERERKERKKERERKKRENKDIASFNM